MDSKLTLIQRIKRGEVNAFKEFYLDFYPSLCIFANKYLEDEAASLDIVQEAFVYYWKKKNDFQTIDSVKAYLFKYIKNRSLNYLRDKKTRDRAVLEKMDSVLHYRDTLIETETYHLINKAISGLSPQGRRIIELSLDGLKNQDIADQLKISINTVKTIKLRAFKALRKELNDDLFNFFLMILG